MKENDSRISPHGVSQIHTGAGDNVSGDKIMRKIPRKIFFTIIKIILLLAVIGYLTYEVLK